MIIITCRVSINIIEVLGIIAFISRNTKIYRKGVSLV